ncbi:MAG: dihydroorotate dehydrogenase electron transfer subunit [Spirochaetales bacterium]
MAAPVYRKAIVVSRKEVPKGYVHLVIREELIARTAGPGQFVMVRGWNTGDPILPRPFDIVRADPLKGVFRLCIKVEGKGTRILSTLKKGSPLYVTGPLGRSITEFDTSGTALLVRGAGAAAVVFLAETLSRLKKPVYTILSASTKSRLVCRAFLEEYSNDLFIATDDGTEGYHGSGTDLLDRLVQEGRVDTVYTCGARRFARHVKALDLEGRVKGYLFLEGHMGCGMGDCHGCAVKKDGQEGYSLVCMEGPVFRSRDVVVS